MPLKLFQSLISKVILSVSLLFLFQAMVIFSVQAAPNGVTVGALRWDFWYNGAPWNSSLYPLQWNYRLPFYTTTSGGTTTIASDSQGVVDQEIQYAKNGGINYWVFNWRAKRNANNINQAEPDGTIAGNRSLKFYLSSARRSDVKFSLLIPHSQWGLRQDFNGNLDEWIDLMKRPHYQTVLGGRPLLFFGFMDWYNPSYWYTVTGNTDPVQYIRNKVQAAGLQNPYIVLLDFKPQNNPTRLSNWGLDAFSSYGNPLGTNPNSQTQGLELPYSQCASNDVIYWNRVKAQGNSLVPIVSTGYDYRPEIGYVAADGSTNNLSVNGNWCTRTTAEEIKNHMQEALTWINENPASVPAKTAIVYAWNEFGEGGWITPTRGDGTTRLDALATILKTYMVLEGDLNNDHTVNSLDWSAMNAVWGTNDSVSDINHDGLVNSIDFSYLNKNWGRVGG